MDSMIPVVNRQAGKLWAFLQFPVTRFLLAFIAIFVWLGAVQLAMKFGDVAPRSLLGALIGLLIAVGVLIIYVFYVTLLERRKAVELAADGSSRNIARGILVGATLFCVTMLVLKILGVWSYTGAASLQVLIYPFVGNVLAAILEEILFRGLLFRILEENLGSWIALAVAAVLFGLAHAFNPGANVLKTTVIITLEAGVLLGAAYMYSRSLWLTIGLHFGWNFTEGGVFAASVSGGRAEGVIGVQFTGPDLLTGGAFGPEASLPAVVICLAAGIMFILLAQRSGRIVAPFWRRKT
jgi:membrane protease YdiL (CAAX protease family)